ncbi:MAG TPA: SNF2-related protein [Tepidisphaeraceae bacterium]|jgi:superfamily II DNA or RNA helicase|nr:SNF2-related protein [Tepidisphaeraceae bacterium]
MSLLQKIIDRITIEARQKGVKCRGTGNVLITEHDEQYIDATIECGGRFIVNLSREPGSLKFACQCKTYTEERLPCEHVWAALLQADTLGYLIPWELPGPIDMTPIDDETIVEEDDVDGSVPIAFDPKSVLSTLLKPARPAPAPEVSDDWRKDFQALRQSLRIKPTTNHAWPTSRQLLYVIDLHNTLRSGLMLELMSQDLKKDGGWSKPRHESLGSEDADRLPDRTDAEIVALLGGAQRDTYGYYYNSHERSSRYRVPEVQYVNVMRRACDTGRCRLRLNQHSDALETLAWDDAIWEFWLTGKRDEAAGKFVLSGELRNGEMRMSMTEPAVLLHGGMLLTKTHAARLDHNGAFAWISLLRKQGEISVPIAEGEELLKQLLTLPELPRLELPQELQVERVAVIPKPRLRVKKPPTRANFYGKPKLQGELSFEYDGHIVPASEEGLGIYQPQLRRVILRDQSLERSARDHLLMLGFREPRSSYYEEAANYLELAPSHLPGIIRTLLGENWYVEADGQLYRQPGEFKMEVSSGIDWFELHGNVDFDGQVVALPELLRALRRGEKTVRLDDGTFGVLPEQWLAKFGLLAGMGKEEEDHVRFKKSQVGLLDAMLMAQPEVKFDEIFLEARKNLAEFTGVKTAEAPPTFVGTLRPYQREGLGWLEFLRRFGFGGCLADDMGLGKTVQVLALLEERRLMRMNGTQIQEETRGGGDTEQEGKTRGRRDTGTRGKDKNSAAASSDSPASAPSVPASPRLRGPASSSTASQRPGPTLVVAPKSLVFNWNEEAGRFAPQLRVLDHTGIGRAKSAAAFDNYDLILTTYGTMRNDIAFLKDVKFDYVVLDEAQAVKNSASESAKAARLLGGEHRLALSGTPVQNHLGELWSLFEFLNPGMLGVASAFQASGAGGRSVDESARLLLSRALRPFILRRTKAQVATELPQRLEQTIHCELDAAQRKQYNDLKEHYRQSLLTKIAAEGINKNKIQVLEALLRLRQAACHPGLIDKSKVNQTSAKLDALLPQLAEVIDGGHKALVFSQFTSMLAIVRSRLDKEKIRYTYLDGKTRDRQQVVEEFQTDPDCRIFLISLKAGGVGLNLTAAEYVFLLDPWWNPAVEAQAIDRAHRIGQSRQVFAYRLIAKDTVEEKVLQLQSSKRELADAIINAENSVIGKLGKEDLELLLS